MHENFDDMDISSLIDLLAKHTSEYTKQMKEGTAPEEFELFKNRIQLLQQEISSRKVSEPDSPVTGETIKPEENEGTGPDQMIV